jgi:hypothetical protein
MILILLVYADAPIFEHIVEVGIIGSDYKVYIIYFYIIWEFKNNDWEI